ncbi:MAG TPA: hypothetical protein VEC57_08005 [Candidatus Limnocylindrales bacterium]|nr:hypothetical protein [Candidatus Limnocylindrales bacterium]
MSRTLRVLLVAVIVIGGVLLLMPRPGPPPPAAPAAPATARDEERGRLAKPQSQRPERERQPSSIRANGGDRLRLPRRGTPERPTKRMQRDIPAINPDRAAAVEKELVEDEPLPRASVRSMLQQQLRQQLPDRKLSTEEYERLTDAVMRYRATQRVIAGMPPSNENAETLIRVRTEVTEILREINELTGVPSNELLDEEKPWMRDLPTQ